MHPLFNAWLSVGGLTPTKSAALLMLENSLPASTHLTRFSLFGPLG